MNEEPCKPEHLRAIRPKLTFWSVDKNGDAVDKTDDYDDDLQGIESYICENCHESWAPENPDITPSWEECWAEALGHLKVGETV